MERESGGPAGLGPASAAAEPAPTRVRSALPELCWPAVPTPHASQCLALLRQLDETQWWPPERLAAAQRAQLGLLLDHAARTLPFYRARLASAGFEPGMRLTDAIWRRIPILARAELQAVDGTLKSDDLPPGHGKLGKVVTSGSTGRPVSAHTTETSRLFWAAITLREHVWQRRNLRGKLAVIRNFDLHGNGEAEREERRGPNWGRPAAVVFETGPAVGLSITTTTARQAEWLIREQPDYLLTFASAAQSLAEHFLARGLALPSLQQLRTISEAVTPELRAAARAAWNVAVVDVYSAQETGYLALQCPEHEHLHLQSEVALVEVLDDDWRPTPPGRTGRVVVTPLHNLATPLIRYELGDLAEVGPPCPCGRGLPVVTRVFGRYRNMLTLPSGDRVWPRLREDRYTDVAPVRQFQVVQKSTEQLEVRLVVDRPLTAEEESAIGKIIVDRLGHTFRLDFTYHDQIPRSPSGKFEDFKSEIAAGGPAPGRAS
ncbi:MAG: phenylacetate--CoA ligase family protein [Kiloniellales bacterium]